MESTKRYALSILFPDGVRENPYMPVWKCSGALWFLPALFWCKLIFNVIYTNSRARLGFYCSFSLCVSCVAAFLGHYFSVNLPLGILIGSSGLFFYCVGHVIREFQLFDKQYPRWSLLVFIPIWLGFAKYTTFAMYSFCYDIFYLVNVAIAIGATVLITLLSKRIENEQEFVC